MHGLCVVDAAEDAVNTIATYKIYLIPKRVGVLPALRLVK